MTMMNDYKAVLFDWAYTLMDLSADEELKAFQKMLATLDAQEIERPDFDTCYELCNNIFEGMIEISRTSHREACFEQVLNFLLTHFSIDLGNKLTPDDLLEAYYRELYSRRKLYADSLPILRMLQDNGLRLGIVSNTTNPAFMKDIERDQSGLDPFFEFSIYSSEVPYRKPHPSIFQLALARLNLDPAEVLFVGDNLNADIVGAQSVGMPTAWLNRKGKTLPSDVIPDYEIKSAVELLTLSVKS